ncbi:hypothetical protein GGI43DRAFT_423003 [Trichoderma evansii]
MTDLALRHPERRLRLTRTLFSAAGLNQVESVIRRYPHLVYQIQRKLSSNSLDDELVGSDNFIPEQYSVDTLAPRFLDVEGFYWTQKRLSCRIWWQQSPRRWGRVQIVVDGLLDAYSQLYSFCWGGTQLYLLELLLNLTRGGVPLMNFVLDYCLADQDLSSWETTVEITAASDQGCVDVLDLDFISGDSNIEVTSEDFDCNSFRQTQSMLASGCHFYQESNVAMEARLSGLTCKVRLRGKVCAQKHIPLSHTGKNYPLFFLEIEALRKLQGGKRISEFVGIVVDDKQQYIKSFLRSWEPHIMTDLLRQSVKVGKPIPWPVRERWAKQIVEAVSFAHSNDVILQKLKLSYFGVDDQNNVKLIRIKRQEPDEIAGWVPVEYLPVKYSIRGYKAYCAPSKEADIFQLGLLLWLLTDFSAAIPTCIREWKGETIYWERRAHPGVDQNLNELPPCQRHIPLYYQAIIKMCRQKLPSNRKGASELLLHFPGQPLSSRNTTYYHQLVYGDIQNKPEDLYFDNTPLSAPAMSVSEFISSLRVKYEPNYDKWGDDPAEDNERAERTE